MRIERVLIAAGAATLLALSFGVPAPLGGQDESEAANALCCFNNPAFTGTCKVVPAEDETCASILAYLNNPMAQGKTYCGGTKIRQGWKEVACEEEDC